MLSFRVICIVRTWFWSGSVVPYCLCLRALSHCKYDMGTLLWLIVEAFERAPTPLFGGLVRCSAHGHSFARLQYTAIFPAESLYTVKTLQVFASQTFSGWYETWSLDWTYVLSEIVLFCDLKATSGWVWLVAGREITTSSETSTENVTITSGSDMRGTCLDDTVWSNSSLVPRPHPIFRLVKQSLILPWCTWTVESKVQSIVQVLHQPDNFWFSASFSFYYLFLISSHFHSLPHYCLQCNERAADNQVPFVVQGDGKWLDIHGYRALQVQDQAGYCNWWGQRATVHVWI